MPIGPVPVVVGDDRAKRRGEDVVFGAVQKVRGSCSLEAPLPVLNGGRGFCLTPQLWWRGEALARRAHGILDVGARDEGHAATKDNIALPPT